MSERLHYFLTKLIEPILPIITALESAGGIPYLVGGVVRDLILQHPIKDLDIEIHNLTLEQVETVLQSFGTVKLVGKQFGVFRILQKNGALEYTDWSLPRTDSCGRKPIVTINPNLGIINACRRRDLTMNAMAIDCRELNRKFPELLKKTTESSAFSIDSILTIIDPFDGQKALQRKELSAVDEQLFIEDPLRFFRVMQFIGRFEFFPDAKLNFSSTTIRLPPRRNRI